MSEWLTRAVKGQIAMGAYNFRMYTKLGGKHFPFNNSYCHVMADLQCCPKQTFLPGLTDRLCDETDDLTALCPNACWDQSLHYYYTIKKKKTWMKNMNESVLKSSVLTG